MFRLIAIALLPIVGAAAQLQAYTLNIVNANVNPDGFARSAVTVNRTFQGALLTANKNDKLHVTVNNALADPRMSRGTSIVSREIDDCSSLVSK